MLGGTRNDLLGPRVNARKEPLPDNSVTPPPLSIHHPIFSKKGPLYTSKPTVDLLDPGSPAAQRWGALDNSSTLCNLGRSACLLSHKSPHLSLEGQGLPFTPPPALPETVPPRRPVDGFVVDRRTGEVLGPLYDTREILHLKGCETEHEYWIQAYHNDLKVKKPSIQAIPVDRAIRGYIFQFSDGSRNRLLFVCRNSGHLVCSQFCCTFHDSWPLDGKSLKKMIAAFIKRLKRRFGSRFHWLWCLEFQERSAPHIHFFSDIQNTDENRDFLADAWLAVSGQSNDDGCSKFHRHPKNFFDWEMKSGAYLAKEYIGKIEQKQVPAAFHNVGRFWGNSDSMKPDFSTIDPKDHDEALQDIYRQATRIVTKGAERKKDHFKTFGVLFSRALDLFGIPHDEISGKNKKMISIGIKLSGRHKTHRLRPPTNLRRRVQSYNLPNMAPVFYDVVNHLLSPSPGGGFSRFSSWAAAQKPTDDGLRFQDSTPPPARRSNTPF